MRSLTIDEMAIRKHVQFCGGKTYGFVDFGGEVLADRSQEAKDALVLMLVAINGSWKIPVGYFLTYSLSGQQKAQIVKQCITKVEECDVKVVSLTFDGACSNISMAKQLGAHLDLEDLRPYFFYK